MPHTRSLPQTAIQFDGRLLIAWRPPVSRATPAALAAIPDPATNVFVEKGVATGQDLLLRLERMRAALGCEHAGRRVRLLVVDSIAHVFRDMGDVAGVAELSGRAELLFRIAALLRRGMQCCAPGDVCFASATRPACLCCGAALTSTMMHRRLAAEGLLNAQVLCVLCH